VRVPGVCTFVLGLVIPGLTVPLPPTATLPVTLPAPNNVPPLMAMGPLPLTTKVSPVLIAVVPPVCVRFAASTIPVVPLPPKFMVPELKTAILGSIVNVPANPSRVIWPAMLLIVALPLPP